jgi:S-adenosylmethionine hydrolase
MAFVANTFIYNCSSQQVPVLSLTSDIGHKDYLAGTLKGKLWQLSPDFLITDITHDVSPFNYNEAAYFIRGAFQHFPPYTWHLVLVNLFDSATPRCLLAFHEGMYFACPDNGLLPMICHGIPQQVIELPLNKAQIPSMLEWVNEIGKAILKMEQGQAFDQLGKEVETMVEKSSLKPLIGPDHMEGRIIYIDRFENVVVNITQHDFETARNGRSFKIQFKNDEKIDRLSLHYGEVNEGDKLAFFNAAGYLEIAVNKGNAAGLFGLQPFKAGLNTEMLKARFFYHTIRILFE